MSDKDERSGRPGALPVSATDDDGPAGSHPFFGPGQKDDAVDAPDHRAAAAEPADGGPGGVADADKTAVVRPVGSPSSGAAKPAAPRPTDAKPAAAGAATTKIVSPVGSGAGSASGSDRAGRYAAAGRGAPAGAAVADKPAQAPRDPDTMAIVRTPGRSGDPGREPSSARETGSSRSGADRPAEQTRKVATVGAAADPDRTSVQKPDLAKPQRPPAVPAERMPTPTPGSRPVGAPTGGPGPDRGQRPAGQEWGRPPVRPEQPPTRDGRYDRPEPRPAAEYAVDYADDTSGRAGRRARLRVTRINPLTVTKVSFAFSLCLFLITIVAVAVLWFVLNSLGVFNSITDAAGTLTTGESHSVSSWLSFGRAMQISLLIGAINVILLTVLSTLGALLYNLCADMIGGIEVTLSDG